MARESSFWNWLRGHLAPLGHFTRIESEISSGVPDVYYAIPSGVDGWIELKSLAAPKRGSSLPLKRKGLRDEQVEWIARHWKLGVRVHILVKLGSVIYCFSGKHARNLNLYTFEEIQDYANCQIPLRRDKKWTRSRLLDHLTSRNPNRPG